MAATTGRGGTSIELAEEVGALRQSTQERLSVVDQVLRAQARHRRLWRAGLAAALILLALFARPVSSSFTGYQWQIVAISHDGTVTSIPARMQVFLQFSRDRQFGANDGINFHSGTYRTTSDGFTTGALAATTAGYVGPDPVVLLAIDAIGSFDNGVHATVKLTGDRLVVGVGAYTLTCQRRGPWTDAPLAGAGG